MCCQFCGLELRCLPHVLLSSKLQTSGRSKQHNCRAKASNVKLAATVGCLQTFCSPVLVHLQVLIAPHMAEMPLCRAAMLGFVLAVIAFSKTGKNIYQQISSWPQPVFAVFALIAVGTLVPILR